MAPRDDSRRLLALVALSVLVHAGVLLGLSGEGPPPQARAARPLELQLAWVDAEPPPLVASRPPPPGPRAPATPAPKAKPVAGTVTPAPASGDTPAQTGAEVPTARGLPGDAPRPGGFVLVPGLDFALRLPGGQGGGEAPRGTTLRNGPGEQPDEASLREYTGEQLSRKLTASLQQDIALAAVGAGNVPGHFKHYEAAMRRALPGAKIDRTPMTGGEVARDVAGILFNAGPSAAAAQRVADSPLGRSVASQAVMMPNVDDQRAREQMLQLLAQGENLKERISRERLRTVLEFTTDPSGALSNAAIVERSGDQRFDESVLHFSRKLARGLPERDDKQLGAASWRSRWQFTWEPPEVRVRLLNAWRVLE